MTSNNIYIGQRLYLSEPSAEQEVDINYEYYTVKKGDTLWGISRNNNITVNELKSLNNLSSDSLEIGEKLKIKEIKNIEIKNIENTHTVILGDTLWRISKKYNVTVEELKSKNNLTTETLSVGQKLIIPSTEETKATISWPNITYIVQAGDTVVGISRKFNVSISDILKYNYMTKNQWIDAGDKIAISGYAPREYTVFANEASTWKTTGKLVDWYLEGQYLIKRWDTFKIIDVETSKNFNVRMMGGYNHSDVEPLTSEDTKVMKEIFGTWKWSPRAVVIYKDGMNIAASLSGMPHGADTIDNNVSGHFDLYLENSKAHSKASESYIQQHYSMVVRAAK
jgi:LysM repeat protein